MLRAELLEQIQDVYDSEVNSFNDEVNYSQQLMTVLKSSTIDLTKAEKKIIEQIASITSYRIKSTEMPLSSTVKSPNNHVKKEDIPLLTSAIDQIGSYWLTAKIYDYLWSTLEIRDSEYLSLALDAYLEFSIKNMILLIPYWERALSLSKWSSDKQSEEKIIHKLMLAARNYDAAFVIGKELLFSFSKVLKQHSKELTKLIRKQINQLEQEKNYSLAVSYWQLLLNVCNKKLSTELDKDAILHQFSNTYYAWALQQREGNQHPLVADSFREAIKLIQDISKNYEHKEETDKRKQLIEHELVKTRQDISDFFQETARSYTTDLSEIIENTKRIVKDQPLESIAYFIYPNKWDIRKYYFESHRKQSFLSKMFFGTSQYYDEDGRLIGKSSSSTEGKYIETIKIYQSACQRFVCGQVLPALSELKQNTTLDDSYFDTLSQNCSLIPEDQKSLAARAMRFGYQEDFSTALMLICPQIESCFRYILKEAGIPTVKIDTASEGESSLTLLLKLAKEHRILNSFVQFEIEAIFSYKHGYNLRNKVAHGLMNDFSSDSIESVLAW